jgi:nucleoside-triphosphatase THEP1
MDAEPPVGRPPASFGEGTARRSGGASPTARGRGSVPLRGPIVVLLGEPGAGKTSVCQRVADVTRHRGLRVSGLLTEAQRLVSGRIVQTVVNLRTGERRRLAEYVGVDEGEPIGRGVAGRFSWTFVTDSVRWGRHELDRCLTGNSDLLVIDQLGPLEMLAGSGWANAVDVLEAGRFELALVVVNPLVVHELRRRINGAEVIEVPVDPAIVVSLQDALAGLVVTLHGDHPAEDGLAALHDLERRFACTP